MKSTLKIMPEFDCSPLWLRESEDDFFENLEINNDEIHFGIETKKELEIWKSLYDFTYDKSNPIESGFKSDIEKNDFEKKGINIWLKLMRELNNNSLNIIYYSNKYNKLFESFEEYNNLPTS